MICCRSVHSCIRRSRPRLMRCFIAERLPPWMFRISSIGKSLMWKRMRASLCKLGSSSIFCITMESSARVSVSILKSSIINASFSSYLPRNFFRLSCFLNRLLAMVKRYPAKRSGFSSLSNCSYDASRVSFSRSAASERLRAMLRQ